MAYAPIPNIVTVHTPKIGCNELSMNTLNEILNSESVKRLLNRQNVYLQTPLTDGSVASDLALSKNSYEKRNGSMESNTKAETKPELSVIPILNLSEKEKLSRIDADDQHLLPSKTEGKSAIALLPLRRENKICGHSEECENLMCTVDIERLVIGEEITPLIAINLESEEEIDAPVSKHCKDDKCDALSIDHDRCRRAVIRCNRCDRSSRCDICLVNLKTRKSKMMHKNCKLRPEYRHNKTSRTQLMKDRMRMRELQILKSTKTRRIDYSDPINGHNRAFESLQRNSELIVIPKTSLSIQHHPTIRITSVTGATTPPNTSRRDNYGKLLPRYPFFPGQKLVVGQSAGNDSKDSPGKSSTRNDPNVPITSPRAQHFISIRRSGNTRQNNEPNDYSPSQPQTGSSSTPYLMPIRVVPISGLTMESPLLTQGVPKFCLVSQTPNQTMSFANTPAKILPQTNERMRGQAVANKISRKAESEFTLKRYKSGLRRGRRKKNGAKRAKSFECNFCSKSFSTDWYFKLHIAKHKGEIKFTCKYCKKPFMHHCNMRKHVMTMHKQEAADDDDEYANAEDDNAEFLHCFNCKVVFNSRIEKENHRCSIVCLRCHARITDGDLANHLKTKHEMSATKVLEEIERQKRQKIMLVQNRDKKKREFIKQQARAVKTKESTKNKLVERENGNLKRKKGASNSNDSRGTKQEANKNQIKMPVRRLTRRRNHNFVDQSDTPETDENLEETSQTDSLTESTPGAADANLISR
ncbi:uncharacterized protein [Venturia canescens]|uniref:uncharacterized protein n=1 Tax=Venturia canescens TaxID=32260 RepID=UPI001C9CDC10|nr:uncharacterized protein LOC122406752 [Venturia canescens]